MDKNEADILLIRKYLNGELNARAMHQLERRAQDDPFLMDALEGYENTSNDQQANLNELSGRLQQRVGRKETRVIPFRFMAIAASVLVVLTAGGLWMHFNNNNKPEKVEVANIALPATKHIQAPKADTIRSADEAAIKPPPLPEVKSNMLAKNKQVVHSDAAPVLSNDAPIANASADKNSTAAADSTPLNEVIVMQYSAQKKKDDVAVAPVVVSKPNADKETAIASRRANDQALKAKVPGLAVTNAPPPDYRYGYIAADLVRGKVIDKNDGLPMPGVTVKVVGTNVATQTDAAGFYKLRVDSSKKADLEVGLIGYQTMHVSTSKKDSNKTIAMVPSNSSLNEVVVTGYGNQKNTDGVVIDAHPQDGWKSFKKYLEENAISPDGKNGTVKLSCTVAPNGAITNIKVIKGLSKATDQKAIDIVSDGPSWVASTTGEPEKVTIKVKFGK